MHERHTRPQLRRFRNEILLPNVFRVLQWPHKTRDGYVRFLCPLCREFNTAVNPATNLGRCFRCERNFNPIDFVIEVQACDFREAIAYLSPLLPPPRRDSQP